MLKYYVRKFISWTLVWCDYSYEHERQKIARKIALHALHVSEDVDRKVEQRVVDIFDHVFFNYEDSPLGGEVAFDRKRVRLRLRNAVTNMVRDEIGDNKSIRLDKLD